MNLKNLCFKTFNIIFIIIFSYIFILSILNPYEHGNGYNINSSILIFYLMFMIILYMGIKHQINSIGNNKILWAIVIICSVVIISLQLIFIKEFRVISYYDVNNLYAEAMKLLEGNTVVENTYYFGIYPYQLITTLIMYGLFKVCSILGIEDYKLALSVFNMFMVDIGFFIGLTYIFRRYNLKKSVISIILIMLFPPIYTYIPYFYTDTLTMVLPIIIFIFYMLYLKTNKVKAKVSYLILIGISIFIGYKIRATIVIVGIAIGIHLVFVKNLKNLIVYLMIVSGICISGSLLYANVEERFLGNNYLDSSLPATHWIMMGLRGDGGYSQDDVDFTNSFETKQEKISNNVSEIRKRIEENGVTGNAQLINNKIRRVWGHGTYGYLNYIKRVEDYGKLYPYIMGEKNIVFLYYSHIYSSFLILMTVIGAVGTFIKNKYRGIGFLTNITLFGWFLFYILWEAHPRYILVISPIILVGSLIGIECLYEQIMRIIKVDKIILNGSYMNNKVINFRNVRKKVSRGILIILCIGTMIIGLYNYDRYVLQNDVEINFVVNQDAKKGKNPIGEITSDKQIIQTFRTDKPFNRIELIFNTYKRENDCDYTVKLIDVKNKNLIKEWVLNTTEIKNRKFEKFNLEPIKPSEITEYAIIITSNNAKVGNALSLDTYYHKGYDIMPSGELYINEQLTESDLQFKVYNETSKELIKYYNYIFIVIVILTIQCIIFRKVLRSFK